MTYSDLKFALSDMTCEALSPVSPDVFAAVCPHFLDGFIVAVELLVLSAIPGLLLAVAFARLPGICALALPANAFACTFRGTPPLVHLWIVNFGIGSLGENTLGPLIRSLVRDAWTVAPVRADPEHGCLHIRDFSRRVGIRGGLVNVSDGQMEAALAIGLPWLRAMRRIMLPQAVRIAWPACSNEIVLLMKGSGVDDHRHGPHGPDPDTLRAQLRSGSLSLFRPAISFDRGRDHHPARPRRAFVEMTHRAAKGEASAFRCPRSGRLRRGGIVRA
jgi:ABC-type arginine/histidine transport system permease subunit